MKTLMIVIFFARHIVDFEVVSLFPGTFPPPLPLTSEKISVQIGAKLNDLINDNI